MSASPRIVERQCEDSVLAAAQQLDLHPVAQRVLSNRATKFNFAPASVIDCGLRDLDSPMTLPDISEAAERIALAIQQGEVIGLETDHDVDGVTSHAVLYQAFHQFFNHPKDKLRSYIGHRLMEGYGLSDALCDRILADDVRPTLIVTADNGSSDGPRITRLLAAGIETVVTDHHGMPEEGPPLDAIACVSPARKDSAYPDTMIAGVMVSFLLMCVVRQRLIEIGYLESNAPKLTGLLDYVALGTVADCVSLARSRNNRAVIRAGLDPINQGSRACWQAIRHHLGDDSKPLTSSDLGFGIGPRINAVGRLDDAMVGVRFLLSDSVSEASQWVEELNKGNLLRREIENELKEEALEVGELQVENGRIVVLVSLTEGHAGVHGIVASRLVERFGRPAVCFSPKIGEPGIITGSARGIEGVHVRDAMQAIEASHPGLLIKFGGHEGAGGMTLKESDFLTFEKLYEQVISEQVGERVLEPLVITDGRIDTRTITQDLVRGLQALEPYGREFESPLFTGHFKMMSAAPMGADKTHWRLKLIGAEGGVFEAVWFSVGTECPIDMSDMWSLAFTPELNWWKGNAKLQLMIRAAERVPLEVGG